jgi:hypothetical protein
MASDSAASPAAQVLYIHPAKQGVGFPYERVAATAQYYLMPVGVIGLLNLLRGDGLTVRGLNEPLERLLDLSFDLAAWLRQHPTPRMVLIDLHWYEHSYGAIDVARLCKRVWPSTPVIMGGMTASGFAQEILDAHHQVDVIIRGDAEEPLRLLARTLCQDGCALTEMDLGAIANLSFRRDWDVIHSPLRYCATSEELDRLDFVDTSFLEHALYYRGLQYAGKQGAYVLADGPPRLGHWLSIGRGCIYDCSYCGGGSACQARLAGRAGVDIRSPRRVAADLARLAAEGVHQAALTLDPCILGESYWEALFSEMRRLRVHIGLYNEHFQLPPLEFVRAFAEAVDLDSSALALSVLSHEPVRRLNGKAYSDAQLLRILSALRERRVPLAIYLSLNLPGETEEGFRRTLALAERIGQAYPPELLRMFGQPHTIDPWSAMSLTPDEYGIEVALRSFSDYYAYCQQTALYHPSMPTDDQHGFRFLGRAPGEMDRIIAMWGAFCLRQPFECE